MAVMHAHTERVVALSGGVGGARLAHGLALAQDPQALTVIVNSGDDFRHCGLYIAPDLDTVTYTLAERARPDTGWGLAGDSAQVMAALGTLGGETWFHLGDADLATHLVRTAALDRGETLTEVTRQLCRALGVTATVLPASDTPSPTRIETAGGVLDFQTWFVRHRCRPPATAVRYPEAARAIPTAAVLAALAEAEAILIGPSNPYLSIGPILALPGFRAALVAAAAPRVAVSPLIGGRALKGPTAEMLRHFSGVASNLALASHYADFLDGLVIDKADAVDAAALAELGLAVHVTDILAEDPATRQRLAAETLAFAATLR